MGKMVQNFCLGLFLQVLAVAAIGMDHHLNIWPMPKSVSHGYNNLYLSNDFQLKTEGSKYVDASGILKDGFSRLIEIVEVAHVIDSNFSHFDHSALLQGMHVVILSPNDEVLLLNCMNFLLHLFNSVFFCLFVCFPTLANVPDFLC